MSKTPPAAPNGAPGGMTMLWSDRRIEDYANARFDASFYFEVVQAMVRIRDEYEAQLAAQSEWEIVPDDIRADIWSLVSCVSIVYHRKNIDYADHETMLKAGRVEKWLKSTGGQAQ